MKIEPDIHSSRAHLNTTRFAIVLLAGFFAGLVIPATARGNLTTTFSEGGGNFVASATGKGERAGTREDDYLTPECFRSPLFD